jgi:hypothetical protein
MKLVTYQNTALKRTTTPPPPALLNNSLKGKIIMAGINNFMKGFSYVENIFVRCSAFFCIRGFCSQIGSIIQHAQRFRRYKVISMRRLRQTSDMHKPSCLLLERWLR